MRERSVRRVHFDKGRLRSRSTNTANYKTEYEGRDLRLSLIARNNNTRVYDFISVRTVLLFYLIRRTLPFPLIVLRELRSTRSASANTRRKFSPSIFLISCSL